MNNHIHDNAGFSNRFEYFCRNAGLIRYLFQGNAGLIFIVGYTGNYKALHTGIFIDNHSSLLFPIDGDVYQIVFDPATLHEDFPNLDLEGRDSPGKAGLSDTFAIGLLLQGESGGNTVYRANTITIQGEQVFIGDAVFDASEVYLPLVLRNSP